MKVYISGPIKDTPDYERNFARAKRYLQEFQAHVVVNPCELGSAGYTYEQFMRVDLMALLDCDAIYMLKGWEKSSGARCEHLVAAMCGLEIRYE
jgi:Domain of unknown function (DUF4406)